MGKIPYVCLYRSYRSELEHYTDEEVGRLIRALLDYLIDGSESPLPERELLFWNRLRDQHDRDSEHYDEVCEVRRINGKKGGRPSKKANGFEIDEIVISKPKEPKEKEKENEKEKDKEKEKDSLSLMGEKRENFSFPILNDVLDYAKEAGLEHLDARHFVDYYEAVGWKCGDKPMENWKAMARLWDKRAKEDAPKGETGQRKVWTEFMYGDYI